VLVLSPLGANAPGGIPGRVVLPGLRPGAVLGQRLAHRGAARFARRGRLALTLDEHGLAWVGARAEHRARWADVASVEEHGYAVLGEAGMNRAVVVTTHASTGGTRIAIDGQWLPFGPGGESLETVVTAWWTAFG
jgi:hypothetical protein